MNGVLRLGTAALVWYRSAAEAPPASVIPETGIRLAVIAGALMERRMVVIPEDSAFCASKQ